MARLTSPTGATVEVADDKAGVLLKRGFTAAQTKTEPAKKAAPKKASSK